MHLKADVIYKKEELPRIDRKAFALSGSTVPSLNCASQVYIPMSAEVGLGIVRRLPKLLTPLVILIPFLFQARLNFSEGLRG